MEIVETEHQVAQFLKKGVNMITREGRLISVRTTISPKALLRCFPLAGDQLKLEEAGGESMLFQVLPLFYLESYCSFLSSG